MATVQPSNTTTSFQNQSTNSPVHSVIKTVEFKIEYEVMVEQSSTMFRSFLMRGR